MNRTNLPELYSQQDVENARTKGQILGWVQGGAVGIGGMVLLGYIGWIPTIAAVALGGFVLFKLVARPSKQD